MSEFVDWLKAEWDTLERQTREKYSARRLSIEAGLSPNTLYQLLNHPEVKPSPETCHKLAAFFRAAPLMVLELAGHVPSREVAETFSKFEEALQRKDLQVLLLSAKELSSAEIQLVQQLVDKLRSRRSEESAASGAAVALVVEDTPDARALYVKMLQLAGLKVLEAADGQRAVELIEANGPLIDVVLMDYRMPRMNGVEATQEIHKHFPNLPVLFVSHWDEPKMKEAAFAAGAAEYLVAPVEYDHLVQAVSRVRRGRS